MVSMSTFSGSPEEKKKMKKPNLVAVVGAGVSGLPCIRHALLHDFTVTCYERQEFVGGLWRFHPEKTQESTVMKSTVTNSSKEMNAYSDFPPPAEEPNYMYNTRMHAYLENYAKHYRLRDCIRFGFEVINITRTEEHHEDGTWLVTVKNVQSSAVSSTVFDAVFVCIGHLRIPHWPSPWPGQEDFQGVLTHAHDYRDYRGYEDKVVVVVGVGSSALDTAVELSRVAKQVNVVTRRGTYVKSRLSKYGRPADAERHTRLKEAVYRWTPHCLLARNVKGQYYNYFNHSLYGLKPKHDVFSSQAATNDELPARIACGAILTRPQISRFKGRSVHFVDGTFVDDVDNVIMGTGYEFDFPLIENGKFIEVSESGVALYKFIFPTNGPHNTLAIIGLVQNPGGIPAVAEMQARVACAAFAGYARLPSKADMARIAEAQRISRCKRYIPSLRNSLQAPYLPLMDEMARIIGCEVPSFFSPLFFDPLLSVHYLCAPHAAYFFRLRGPHAWAGAREAILGIEDRIAKGTSRGRATGTVFSFQNSSFLLFAQAVAFIAFKCTAFIIYKLYFIWK